MPITKKVMRAVTEEDLVAMPELSEQGIEVGEMMKLPPLLEKNEDEEDSEDEDSDDEDSEDESDEEETYSKKSDSAKSSKTKSITFKINNPNVKERHTFRTFSLKDHGPKFEEIAASFEKSNTHVKPANMLDAKEVEECVAHNKAIKHHIISKEVK